MWTELLNIRYPGGRESTVSVCDLTLCSEMKLTPELPTVEQEYSDCSYIGERRNM